MSSNVIRSALFMNMVSYCHGNLSNFIDLIAEILEVASRLSLAAKTEPVKQQWFIVRAFLWNSWQRCTMIYFFSILDRYLMSGFNDLDSELDFTLQGTVPSPQLSIQEISKLYAGSKKSKYMCGWAFELLRAHPVCIGMDFRRFHQRYSETFHNNHSRCIATHQESSCKGDHPDACQRFKGMFIENQSAHDLGCLKDCERLTWDEASYRSIFGARAVSIDGSTGFETKIQYCEASNMTLAVSHVWSYGQGGRPEEPHGFNHCLHHRYISIARLLGCTSYWMDTPCIPEDHELRAESISKINEVFMQSKITLVCDRDLMEIDITDLSIDVCERLLVTVIVCDWNIRAWTFLEAFRGRDNIYLLCKNNAFVPLKKIVEIVQCHGSIDVGFLLLTAPHLLPSSTRRDFWESKIPGPARKGYLSFENSASLLGHRKASRPGDEIVIWSLLLGEQVFENAESFWRSRENNSVQTSYLLSSTPRLEVRGLGWAPSSPTAYLLSDPSSKSTSGRLGYGLHETPGRITRDGLLATWYVHEFTGSGMMPKAIVNTISLGLGWDWKLSSEKLCRSNFGRIREKYLKGYPWGCLLQPEPRYSRIPILNQIGITKILVVVCATKDRMCFKRAKDPKDDRIFWEWKGIYEWDLTEPLPKFQRVRNILIV